MNAHSQQADDTLLTARQVAERLQLSPRRIREYAASGKLPVIRLNKRDLRFHWPTVLQRLAGS